MTYWPHAFSVRLKEKLRLTPCRQNNLAGRRTQLLNLPLETATRFLRQVGNDISIEAPATTRWV